MGKLEELNKGDEVEIMLEDGKKGYGVFLYAISNRWAGINTQDHYNLYNIKVLPKYIIKKTGKKIQIKEYPKLVA